MSDQVYRCSARGCEYTYRSPLKLSSKYPPTHEHASKKVHTMKKVTDGQEETATS